MDRSDDNTLFAELRELRPTPRPEFAADLDARAAAGFPRGADTTASVFAPLLDWWRGMSLRGRIVPALGFALTILVVATVVVSVSQSGGGGSIAGSLGRNDVLHAEVESPPTEEGAESSEAAEAAPTHMKGHAAGKKSAGGTIHGEAEYEAAEGEEGFSGNFFGEGEAAGGATKAPKASAAPEVEAEAEEIAPEAEKRAEKAPKAEGLNGAAGGRDIERSSYIVLGTKPGEVSGAAAKVYEAVHTADGFVLNSSVQSGTTGATGASFELSIPTAKVNSALAAISAIAEVRERHDATTDITAPTVSVAEELADSNAAIAGLLTQLGEVETEAEQESVEARLREERRHHAAIRGSLDHLHQRASMSEISVRIVTKNGAGVTPPSKDDGNWGVGDALHDAGHILSIAASVILVGLAVLAPFALFALIFWAGNRFRVRRLRERTLG